MPPRKRKQRTKAQQGTPNVPATVDIGPGPSRPPPCPASVDTGPGSPTNCPPDSTNIQHDEGLRPETKELPDNEAVSSPAPVPSIHMIGTHITSQLKQRIISGQYIELSNLLPPKVGPKEKNIHMPWCI